MYVFFVTYINYIDIVICIYIRIYTYAWQEPWLFNPTFWLLPRKAARASPRSRFLLTSLDFFHRDHVLQAWGVHHQQPRTYCYWDALTITITTIITTILINTIMIVIVIVIKIVIHTIVRVIVIAPFPLILNTPQKPWWMQGWNHIFGTTERGCLM